MLIMSSLCGHATLKKRYNSVPSSQPAFTCSKLTIQTLEQGVKYVKVNNKDTSGIVLVSLLLTLNIFHSMF